MAERSMFEGGGRRPLQASKYDHQVERVGPAKAKEWLLLNVHNRPLSKRRVERYARDMLNGDYEYCGDPVRFNGDGSLIDGQHRLTAIVETGMEIELLVIRGLPVSVQEKLDAGGGRKASDFLHLRKYNESVRLAATARTLYRIRHRTEKSFGPMPTNSEVVKTVLKHPRLVDSVEIVSGTMMGVHPSLLSAVHYVGAFLLKDKDTADRFVGVFQTGKPSYDRPYENQDPAHLWRERLVKYYDRAERLPSRQQLIGTIHAWNLFRTNERVQQFRRPDDATFDGLDINAI